MAGFVQKQSIIQWLLLVVIIVWTSPTMCQITPPPQINDSPVIADNRVYYLKTFPPRCGAPIIDTFPGGFIIKDSRAMMKKDNPHIIRGNIQIAAGGCLYIEPGAVLKFAPGQGIIVNGTLTARGSQLPGGRITMTKLDGEDLMKPSGDWQDDARLVMGNTTKDGRLDLKYKGRWRAVCSNYNNFTAIDANVTCRHLGFLKGNFTYHSFARNLTDYILWEKPDCKGAENNLFDCPGANSIKIGRHICDGQEVIGFQCEGLRPGLATDHWRGIDFYNSTTEARFQLWNNTKVYMNESLSFLEYLDISYSGLDSYHGQTSEPDIFYQKAAISASPHVPMINNVTVKYGAYDAMNFTEVIGPIHIANSTLSYNRGYGMFIQSSVGRTLINMTEVNNNWGDGIKFYLSNLTIFDFRLKFPPERSFCAMASTQDVVYPFYQHMDLVQVNGNERTTVAVGGSCERTFSTSRNMKISVHFMIIERDPDASGEFIFIDGGMYGEPLQTVPINNGSFPQSITTKSNAIYINFRYKQPKDLFCKTFPPCIRFLLEFTSGYDVEEEFRLIMSNVHDNIGYGVNIQDMRCKVRISNETIVANNQFGAGVLIYKGAGDIVINGTRIENNADAGINITYSGGYQLINSTQIIGNQGYGIITEYMKLNRTRIESRNKIEFVRSQIMWNDFIGLRMGNYCLAGDILINETYFAYNRDEAFEYLSCNRSTMYKTKLRVEFNKFNGNFRHAILMRPLLNTELIITNNTFANHTLSTLRIDNGYDLLIGRWYRDFPVIGNIFENIFVNNMGRYVINIRLTQDSAMQNLSCKFNYFQQNEINNSFPFLQPRSRANAVIVLSSSNVQFRRNFITNPGSVREVATHLVDPSAIIDAQENYWGIEINKQTDYEKVYNSIFDQDDRYNLAKVKYHPALKTLRLYDNYISNDDSPYIWQFQRGNVIGGTLENTFVVGPGKTYYVDKDIYIFPDKTLQLEPSSKLKFAPSIGMVVHGILRADGMKTQTPVTFDMDDREEFVPMENRTTSIRLVDGYDDFEGRLEVEINGTWGTVCGDGWIEENSLLACQQLGLSFNRNYPVARRQLLARSDVPILMSWVSCDDVDVDLTQCRSINVDAETCDHSKDVYLRCQIPTWAGITLAAAYKHDQIQPVQSESQIRFVDLNNAGLFDPDTATMTPALRIDYNYYQISWLTIRNSVSDGILVSFNHPTMLNKMEYITVLSSAGNGIVTKSPKLEIIHSRLDSNQMAGFLYDPFFKEYDALLIRNMIHPLRRIDMFAIPQRILQQDQLMFLICSTGYTIEKREFIVEVKAASQVHRIVLQVLDYLPLESVEKVIVYDSDRTNINSSSTRKWEIEKDLVDFPILSRSSILTIQLKLNGQLSGRLAFAVFPQNYDAPEPLLRTYVYNTTFNRNNQGVVTKHYNNPSNKRLELFYRHKEEQIYFKDVKIYNSIRHAMHMPSVTKFNEGYLPTYEDMTQPERVAVINYTIFLTEFRDNAIGILAEHNHVDFANNVWQWNLDHVNMQGSLAGGLEIEVPRVNDGTVTDVHAVKVVDSRFENNQNFAFTIAGYHTQVNVSINSFANNKCLLGLISITGMEKNLTINSNIVEENVCRYMVDIDVISHSEYFTSLLGEMSLNDFKNNRYEGQLPPHSVNSPQTYAVAVRGVQNIKANYNLFRNPTLDYEFVAGITSILLGSSVNITLNFWGFTDQQAIRKRIFDFDEWNNFAIGDYFPYLTVADPNSVPSTGAREEIYINPTHLGGRVERSQILTETGRPYIVRSDLTIMPGVTLTIPPGTELQLMPNVGILVLGRLVANGLLYSRIKFKPVQPSNNPEYLERKKREVDESDRFKRDSAALTATNIRLRGDGTLFKDAGFLELYNTSSKSWNMMCDSQFHEKTAEVVCRELGKEVINVKVRFTYLYDYYIYGKPMYSHKEFWYNSYYCRGDETSLSQCITRYNYNLLNCVYAANYTFITCGARNLDPRLEYWGNIRFAMDAYEEKPLEADIGIDRSSLTYVDIEGAGMLHGEKVGAIQSTYVTPIFRNINMSNCAENGYDIIAPRLDLDIQLQNISGNLGYGVNILVLNGESRMQSSTFQPRGPSTVPYSIHGLVDICRLEKEIRVETRLLLFYKYGPYTRSCVKIIRSRKTVGFRLLQINLFQEDFTRNSVEIYDGESASNGIHIGHILANSSDADVQRLYQTTGNVMAVHVHASVSFGSYGFIAEIVRLPLAGLTYPNSEYSHTIKQAEIRKNEDGAIQYKNVGETTPSLFIEHCWLGDNGYPILNLTSPPVIDISLQSTISFRFSHNQVAYNYGGMYLFTYTSSLNTALKGNMTNNVFAFGYNGEALNISGHYYQHLMMFQNYFYNYTAGDYRDVIHIRDVVVNMTHNYILKNVGHYIIHTYNSDDGTESQSLFARNGIFDNNATALRESTIKIGSGNPKFVKNLFVNNLNDFEMATYPMTMASTDFIDAKDNWWGSDTPAYINGKIYDNSDDTLLVPVDFRTQILDNRSLVEGNCLSGWVYDNKRCYRYMGGALPFEEAKKFCLAHGAFLAEGRNREDFFNYLMRLMLIEPDWLQRVWIMSDGSQGHCSAFEKSYIVYEEECNRKYYPFICETDPQVTAPSELLTAIQAMIIGISVGVGGIIIIIIIVIVILWCIKSKRREKERFERTASIRSSLNVSKTNGSLRGTKSTITVLSDGPPRRRPDEFDSKSVASSYGRASQNSAVSNGFKRSNLVASHIEHRSLDPANRDSGRSGQGFRREYLGAREIKPQAIEKNPKPEIRKEIDKETTRPHYGKDDVRVEQRGAVKEDTTQDSDDSYLSDSTFNEMDNDEADSPTAGHTVDASNMQCHINKSTEQLVHKPQAPVKFGIDFPIRPGPGGQRNQPDGPHTNLGSNFAGPLAQPSKSVSAHPRTAPPLPPPPPDPQGLAGFLAGNKQPIKPPLRPKPLPAARKKSNASQAQGSASQGRSSPMLSHTTDSQQSAEFIVPSPQTRSIDSQDHLYNNDFQTQTQAKTSVSDQSLRDLSHIYNNMGNSYQNLNHPVLGGTLNKSAAVYDPVNGGTLNRSATLSDAVCGGTLNRSAPRYDPVSGGGTLNRSAAVYDPVSGGTLNRSAPLYDPVSGGGTLNRSIALSDAEHGGNLNRSAALYDPVYNTRSHSSAGYPSYDPVYSEKLSDNSQSTGRYEPIEYNPAVNTPYGVDQQPDDDYMPRPQRNPAVGHSREHFSTPSLALPSRSLSFQEPVQSDLSVPSMESDVDYIPRQQNPNLSNRFLDSLPPEPRESRSPRESLSSQNSRESMNSCPPPYSAAQNFQPVRFLSHDRLNDDFPAARLHSSDRQSLENQGARSHDHDRLNCDFQDTRLHNDDRFPQEARSQSRDRLDPIRGSIDHLHKQSSPNYPGGEELIPRRHGGSRDILYLSQGTRPKHQSFETEI